MSERVSFPQTWFNFQRDVLYINLESIQEIWDRVPVGSLCNDEIYSSDFSKVENLAVLISDGALEPLEFGHAQQGEYLADYLVRLLDIFGGIKTLTLVHAHANLTHPEVEQDGVLGQLEFLESWTNVAESIRIFDDVIFKGSLKFAPEIMREN
jgi:hypothetical protein